VDKFHTEINCFDLPMLLLWYIVWSCFLCCVRCADVWATKSSICAARLF